MYEKNNDKSADNDELSSYKDDEAYQKACLTDGGQSHSGSAGELGLNGLLETVTAESFVFLADTAEVGVTSSSQYGDEGHLVRSKSTFSCQ